jgi:hypothetical protein
MDPIKNGDKIFKQVSESVNWTESSSLNDAYEILKKLIIATKGLVIVDFLDSGNWDCLDGIDIDEENNLLYIHWRDYRSKQESSLEKDMRMLAFPASLTSSLIKFKELRILNTKRFPIFLIRGFALKDKEIKKILNKGSTEYNLFDNKDNFSKLAIRKINNQFEKYTCLNTPIFSMLIIPKNSGISSFDSKKALLSYNLSDALSRLDKVRNELEDESLSDEDIICEKSNSIRRIFEYVLKVELCYRYRQISVKKDYSDLMLGDLKKLVSPFREDSINDFLTRITIWTNELSHESGKPIRREKAVAVNYMTILYTQLLSSEIDLNAFPHWE